MKRYTLFTLLLACVAITCTVACSKKQEAAEPTLKEAFGDKFLIGVALNDAQVTGEDSICQEIVKKHFNTIVAENVMKSAEITPEKGVYNWEPADRFVQFGEDNDMYIVGHCLVWHSQLAPWFPFDDNGEKVDSATLVDRMRTYIYDVVGRYKGRVNGWDVVNEAIVEDGSYRHSPFYDIIGEEFIPLAFQFAHEADPDADLFINDYGMNVPGRRDKYVEIVNNLKERGLRIDAIGMQAHMGIDYPDFDEFKQAFDTLASTGCQIMFTEWDMSALPTVHMSANISETEEYQAQLNPYPDGLPADVDSLWNARMGAIFDLALNNSDKVFRVNAWGVADGDSWKNDWPIPGRTDYPLLFDRNHEMKSFLKERLKTACANDN